MASRSSQGSPNKLPRGPHEAPKTPQETPRGTQEAPKRPQETTMSTPRGPKTGTKCPKRPLRAPQEAPRGSQEAPRGPQEAPGEPLRPFKMSQIGPKQPQDSPKLTNTLSSRVLLFSSLFYLILSLSSSLSCPFVPLFFAPRLYPVLFRFALSPKLIQASEYQISVRRNARSD